MSESTGRSGTAVNSNVCDGSVRVSTPRTTGRPSSNDNDVSRPSEPISPTASGITIGSFTGCPGVGGAFWVSSSRYVCAVAS